MYVFFVAIIALMSSLAVAATTYFFYRKLKDKETKNNERMEILKNEFAKELESFKTHPLRGYENEARQRLYHEYEPLRFQFAITSDRALHRILSLAQHAREGQLLPCDGWLSNKDSYFLTFTVYTLLLPLALFKIMHSRLTLYDVRLLPHYKDEYTPISRLCDTFTADYVLARSEPRLYYSPEGKSSTHSMSKKEAVDIETLDGIVDSLIKIEAEGSYRV
jgi:hypothetical protein